ncbi:MAG: ATP-binding cassette domain-containing protein [Bacteroidales bacterium]|nr:ATP-binding cassette domain-containing protein [Bacteroidales bacterium]
MEPAIIKQIVRLFAICIQTLRGENANALIKSFLDYFNSSHTDIDKRTVDTLILDYKKRLLDKGLTVDQLIHEVIQDVRGSMGYKDQLLFYIVLLDTVNQFEAFERIVQPEKIASELGISEDELMRYKNFITAHDPFTDSTNHYLVFSSEQTDPAEKLEGKWIEDRIQQQPEDENILEIDNFKGKLLVMYLKPIQSFIIRCIDNEWVEVDGIKLKECKFKILGTGSSINVKGKPVLSYGYIKQRYIQQQTKRIISLSVNNLQLESFHTQYPIHSISVREQSGSLVGILGKEGSGKSTLLKLLAGYVVPDKGNIEINGYDLQKNRYLLKDIIGYVPEEDLLFEELTVYDNLLMNARLYYSGLSGHEVRQKVDQLMAKLLITEIRDKIVGNVLDKNIQPGQRRILNIALEIMREPQILLVDNALSGLSMADSARVIKILHNYTLEGNLAITSITQVGSNMFGYFDAVWILDEGGYPVYTGPPQRSVCYLCNHLNLHDQCPEVIDPATIIDLVNYSLIRREDCVAQRILSPEEWHHLYMASIQPEQRNLSRKSIFPTRQIKIPNLEVQFLIFSLRNFLCKFSRINNIIFALLSGPVIALILGFFLRQQDGAQATFASNSNLPAYQFISVMVAMFMGIVISSGEILKERNILHKEQYLAFSRFSYINSKIFFLLIIVALQSLLYTVIGNALLGIKEMTGPYWIVLYSVACFGVLTGLLFSSSVKKLSVIYEKLVPIFLALQVLFGGGVISYHALRLEKTKYVPVIGELMVSRWGYEALAVKQFSGNQYQKNYLSVDKNISRSDYYAFYLVPELAKMVDRCLEMDPANDSLPILAHIVYNELKAIAQEPEVFPFEFLGSLNQAEIDPVILTETRDYLTYLELFFYEQHEALLMQKNQITHQLIDSLGQEGYNRLKNDHHNAKLEKIVTNSDYTDQIELIGNRFIRFRDGIYQSPVSNYGRAVMFTPIKIFNGQEMNTLWFNVSIIWIFSTLIYLLLLTDAVNFIRRNRTS